ncbi:hypothetical protein [Planomonospora venezuelensis]|uniref:Secreted protein n=1 Tax=Planomonospora venezuelensis TaxID=1999 RepID=A0A841DAG9_PLAVE|nr:hypothetical protein [Planomonospora venezuelensis]MBB5967622.1 hypothetical protein [Planomonospora venezuelensis]GIN00274.1 hypothetical protein Pve01_19320 [Planomonospora venezuelensis]
MSVMKAVPAEPFRLRRDGGRPPGIAVLERELDRVPLSTVLAKANRVAARRGARGTGAFGSMKPRPADWYCFDAGDNDVTDWYPQGLTGSADAGVAGNVYVVSWYFKPADAPERGIRLSFLNAQTLRYRHVLLVGVGPDGGIVPIDIHAGGVAWYGDLLYVADTTRGFRVFDTRHIYEVNGEDGETIGRKDGVYNAFGYRYVMPQTGAWTSTTGTARFSFAAVDRDSAPDLLVSGEYVDEPGRTGRVARWPLAADGTLRAGGDGVADALDAYALPGAKIQGALSRGSTWYLSQSAGASGNGTLIVAGEKLARRPYPIGPEDLTRVRDQVWSVSEFPGRRVVYGVPL